MSEQIFFIKFKNIYLSYDHPRITVISEPINVLLIIIE